MNETQDINLQLQSLLRRSYLLISIIFFAACLGLAVWGIIPQVENIFTSQNKIKQEQQNLSNLNNKLKQVSDINSNAAFASIETVDEVLYTKNPFLESLYTLLQVADDNNLNFTRFELSPGLIATPSAQFQIKQTAQSAAARNASKKVSEGFTIFIEARGQYNNLANFLHSLENYAPFSSVAYSEIHNTLSGSAVGQFEILAQYYPPDVVAKLDEALPALNDEDQATISLLRTFEFSDLSSINQLNFVNYNRDNPFMNQISIPEEIVEELTDQAGEETVI